ncbi:MAG: hypothetical protein K0U98_14100 [Deltaproteobacteria bacterium]|nr:hypothetical protein [Deltaproteobacteria bacterium]
MIYRSVLRGFALMITSPGVLLTFWLASILMALPAGFLLSESLQADLGSSQIQENLRSGFDMDWYSEFSHRAEGLGETFRPDRVVGIGPLLDNLESWSNGNLFANHRGLVALAAIHALAWAVLLGGALGSFARPGGSSSAENFLALCGRYCFRLVRLALVSAPLYYGVYRLSGWLLERVASMSRDATREIPIFVATLLATLAIAALLHLIRMVFDYAKIILVTEERRSALGAALSGLRFVASHPVKTSSIYGIFGLVSLLLLVAFGALSPGVGQETIGGVLAVLAFGQLYLIAKIFTRLSSLAGQMEAYRWSERR